MSLLAKIIEPLVEYDIAAPTTIEFLVVLPNKPAQGRVPASITDRHCLGKLTVKIGSDCHVGINKKPFVGFKVIGKRERHRITTSLQYFDVQIAITCYA